MLNKKAVSYSQYATYDQLKIKGVPSAFVYLRGTKEQIQSQLEEIEKYAENRFNIIGIFDDENVSSLDMERPSLNKMLADLEETEVVIVSSASVLSRSMVNMNKLEYEFESKGIEMRIIDKTKRGVAK